MSRLYALKLTAATPVGVFSGLITAASEDYDATCAYRDNILERVDSGDSDLGSFTLVDGQSMVLIPEDVAQQSVMSFEVIDATP